MIPDMIEAVIRGEKRNFIIFFSKAITIKE